MDAGAIDRVTMKHINLAGLGKIWVLKFNQVWIWGLKPGSSRSQQTSGLQVLISLVLVFPAHTDSEFHTWGPCCLLAQRPSCWVGLQITVSIPFLFTFQCFLCIGVRLLTHNFALITSVTCPMKKKEEDSKEERKIVCNWFLQPHQTPLLVVRPLHYLASSDLSSVTSSYPTWFSFPGMLSSSLSTHIAWRVSSKCFFFLMLLSSSKTLTTFLSTYQIPPFLKFQHKTHTVPTRNLLRLSISLQLPFSQNFNYFYNLYHAT